tara:strand:- start:98 stop:262 length:165 start_codon:yes stop_codon:yes gene_type:complete
MTLQEVQEKLRVVKEQLELVPKLQEQYHQLLGMEKLLTIQKQESEKPELKVASK